MTEPATLAREIVAGCDHVGFRSDQDYWHAAYEKPGACEDCIAAALRAAPPSGLTPPSGGATAPDPREAQSYADATPRPWHVEQQQESEGTVVLICAATGANPGYPRESPCVAEVMGENSPRGLADARLIVAAVNAFAPAPAERSEDAPEGRRCPEAGDICYAEPDECGNVGCAPEGPTSPVAGAPEGGLTPDVERVDELLRDLTINLGVTIEPGSWRQVKERLTAALLAGPDVERVVRALGELNRLLREIAALRTATPPAAPGPGR